MRNEVWVIWRNRNNDLNRIQFVNYNAAKIFFDNLEDFKVAEISHDRIGIGCGVYQLSKNKNIFVAC